MRELKEITKIEKEIEKARTVRKLESIEKKLRRRLKLYTTKYRKTGAEKWRTLISKIRGLLIKLGRRKAKLLRKKHDYVEFTFTGYYEGTTKHNFEARISIPIRSDLIPYEEEIPETRIRTLFEHYRWLIEQRTRLLKEKRRLERRAVINMIDYTFIRYTYSLYECLLDIVSKIEKDPLFRQYLDKCLQDKGVKYKRISVSLYIPVDTLKELTAITSCMLDALIRYHITYYYQYRITEHFSSYMLEKAGELGDRFLNPAEQVRIILAYYPPEREREEWRVAYRRFSNFVGKLVERIQTTGKALSREFYRRLLRDSLSRRYTQELMLLRDIRTLIECMDKATGRLISGEIGKGIFYYLTEFEKVMREIIRKGFTGEPARRYKYLSPLVQDTYRRFYSMITSWIDEATEEARRRQEELLKLPEIEKQLERIREEAKRIREELEKERKKVRVEDVTPIVLDLLYDIMVNWYVYRLPYYHEGMLKFWDIMKESIVRVGVRILVEDVKPLPEYCTIVAEVRCKEHPNEVYRVKDCVWNWKERFRFLVEDWFLKGCDKACERVSTGYLEEPRYKRYTRKRY